MKYLHLFPFNYNTSTQLFWIEWISFLRVSDGISFQYCLMQDFKVSLSSNLHLFLYIILGKIPHKFSIGFKSGDLVGQSKTSIFFILNQYFMSLDVCIAVLSCWKMALLVSRRFINGKRHFSNTLIYQTEFCFSSITTKSAFPDAEKLPKPWQILLKIVFLKTAASFLNHANNTGSHRAQQN